MSHLNMPIFLDREEIRRLGLTPDENREFRKLTNELFDNCPFVVLDETDPRAKRYLELNSKHFKAVIAWRQSINN